MNVLFVHDRILYKDKNGDFFSMGDMSNSSFIHKYIDVSSDDKLYVYTRYNNVEEEKRIDKINNEKLICMPSEYYKGPLDYFTKYSKIYAEMSLENIDTCVVRLPSVLGSIIYDKAIKNNVPVFVEMVGCPWDSIRNYGGIKGKIFAPIMAAKTKFVLKNAKYVHYVSKNFLQKRYPTKYNSLGCSDVVINELSKDILNKKIDKIKSKSKEDKYILGIIGSLDVKYKGHDTCIKALSLLKNEVNFELHCLGGGSSEKWEKMCTDYGINDRVFFDGTLPSGQPVLEWIDNLDIHLMMSKTEGLPRSLVEAMSRASISIGADVGGIPELLREDFILEKNNYKALAKKILQIINDKDLQKDIASRNFKFAKEYEYTKLKEQRDAFYKKFIKENVISEK